MTVGTLTVGVDAAISNARKNLETLTNFTAAKAKQIGNMKVGEGSLFSREHVGNAIAFTRQQFVKMIDDIERFRDSAAEAGKSIEEFTNGAFSPADVEQARQFSESLDRISTTFSGGNKQLLIDIAPLAAESIQLLDEMMQGALTLMGKAQVFARGVGSRVGDIVAPADNRDLRPGDRVRQNDGSNRGPVNLLPIGLERLIFGGNAQQNLSEERRAAREAGRQRREQLEAIRQQTEELKKQTALRQAASQFFAPANIAE